MARRTDILGRVPQPKSKSSRTTQPKPKPSRYTPPSPKKAPASPMWVPTAMFCLLLGGCLVVITNYLGLLPGGAHNRYLILGLVEICAGFVFATRYR